MTTADKTPQQGQTDKPQQQQQGQTPKPAPQQGQPPVFKDWAAI
jgi:hypothetical protein